MHRCIKFILFWNDALHASDGLSVHYQEFKTLHTETGICLLLYVQSLTPDDGRNDRPKHVECYYKIK